jgi:hypothetical protein
VGVGGSEKGDAMNLIRPNGLIERLSLPRLQVEPESYGRAQPGPATAETLRLAARQERRRQPRRKADPLRGRLIDVTA